MPFWPFLAVNNFFLCFLQKLKAGTLLIRSFPSNQMSNCEQFAHGCSGPSEEMSDHERIAQVAQDKWATVSNSLRSLRGNEQMSDSLKKIWLTKSNILFFSMFYIQLFYLKMSELLISSFWWPMGVNRSGRSPKMSNVSKLLWLLTKNEGPWAILLGRSEEMSDREQIAQIAHQKWANEWIVHFLRKKNRSFTHFWAKNEWFARKTKEQIPSPAKTKKHAFSGVQNDSF